MGRINFNGIEDYVARDATVVNGIQNAFVNQSATFDDANFRDEGLDARALDGNVITRRGLVGLDYKYSTDRNGITRNGTGYTLVNFSAVGDDDLQITSGWTVGSDEYLRIRSAMMLSSSVVDLAVRFQLWQRVGGVYSAVSGTTQTYRLGALVAHYAYSDGAVLNTIASYRDDYAFTWLIPGPATIERLEIRSAGSMAGDYVLRWGTLQVVHFKR